MALRERYSHTGIVEGRAKRDLQNPHAFHQTRGGTANTACVPSTDHITRSCVHRASLLDAIDAPRARSIAAHARRHRRTRVNNETSIPKMRSYSYRAPKARRVRVRARDFCFRFVLEGENGGQVEVRGVLVSRRRMWFVSSSLALLARLSERAAR